MAKLIEITGKALSGEWGYDDEAGNGIPVLRTTNFTNDGIVNYENVVTRTIVKKNLDEKFLRQGDIIIEKSGGSDKQPVGRVIFFDGPENVYLFNNFTGLLRVKNTTLWYPRYVFYALYANYRQGGTRPFENKTTGLHNLKTDDYVTRFVIEEAPLQKQISACLALDKVQSIIDLRKQQLSTFDTLIKARFVEMFGDPVSNPKGWHTSELLDIGNCKNGMNFHTQDSGIGIHCLGVGDFKDKSIITATEALPMISLNEMPSKEYLLRDGDIVFVRSNGNKALVGRCLAIYPRQVNTTFSGFCIRFRSDSKDVATEYLIHVLKTESMRKKMQGRGANIQNLNQQILGSLIIPLPPIELQNDFASFVAQVDKSKFVCLSAIKKSMENLNFQVIKYE